MKSTLERPKNGAEGVTRRRRSCGYLSGKEDRAVVFPSVAFGRLYFLAKEKMELFGKIIQKIDDFVWGIPLIVLILGAGIYLTVRFVFLPIRRLPRAFKYMFKKEEGAGEVSSFGALCTALSATIGTGNIVGVATAIVAGGPGALFWMWLAAFFGMATKYAEGLLAVKYRKVYPDGHTLGGPFHYIEGGLGRRWKFLAVIFAVLGMCVGLFGIGTFSQVNSITDAVGNIFAQAPSVGLFGRQYNLAVIISGIVLTIAVGLVLLGGVKRIAKVSEMIVPFMVIVYVLACLIILGANVTAIPRAFADIFVGAFSPKAVMGGAAGSFFIAMQKGIARGIFSNEAGLGSAPIAAAAAKTKEPVRQGLVSMTGTFLDTLVVCTMTGLAIVITGAWNVTGLQGVSVTMSAFENGLPGILGTAGPVILMVCLIFFAFTTILGWNFYGERCLEYLAGRKKLAIYLYRAAYILAVFAGPYMTVAAVWNIADIFNGLMAIPNLIALFLLSGVAARETKKYFQKYPTMKSADEEERAETCGESEGKYVTVESPWEAMEEEMPEQCGVRQGKAPPSDGSR